MGVDLCLIHRSISDVDRHLRCAIQQSLSKDPAVGQTQNQCEYENERAPTMTMERRHGERLRRASGDTFPYPGGSVTCDRGLVRCGVDSARRTIYHLRHQNERGVPKVHFVMRFEFFVFSERESDFQWAECCILLEIQTKELKFSCTFKVGSSQRRDKQRL